MSDPAARLIASSRRTLFLVTLGLVVLLVVGIGTAAAVVSLRALDSDVDRALAATVDGAAAALRDGLPTGTSSDTEDAIPAASDTFLLVLDHSGAVVANPSHVRVGGLPDASAVAAAQVSGRDLRTIDAGGIALRLLTVPIVGSEDGSGPTGFVQGGFVLTLHDEQSRNIVSAILIVGIVGLVGAALVTLIVTDRALIPIRRSVQSQRRFVADASHELRTPAALIRANADVIQREGLVTGDGTTLVADIIAEADRLGRLVGDLLQLAATDAKGIVPEARIVDLSAIATETTRRAEALASGRGLRIVVRATPSGGLAGKSTAVRGQQDQLVQVALILLDNALDHSPPGGTVTVEVRRVGSVVEMIVADEGPGVPVVDRERIFEPFAQSPGLPRDRTGGTGLGLAIARRLVTAHRGTIQVTDGSPTGAAFVVTLPAAGVGTDPPSAAG